MECSENYGITVPLAATDAPRMSSSSTGTTARIPTRHHPRHAALICGAYLWRRMKKRPAPH
ncbi:MAG: hypothetical protein ACLRPT_02465 [Akkermansia muciniphila]